MANVKTFSDLNGNTVELTGVWGMDNAKFAVAFPGVKGRRFDSFQMMVGTPAGVVSADRNALPVTRTITYKSNPSKHVCSDRCINAKPNGACECACGGKNHGAGGFVCEQVAA